MSTIKADALKGATSAGDITITAGSATSSLQSGLVKAWGVADQGSLDTPNFNLSSITDNQAGDNSFNYTNNFGNLHHAVGQVAYGPSSGQQEGTNGLRSANTAYTRLICFDEHKNSNGRFDTVHMAFLAAGDLA